MTPAAHRTVAANMDAGPQDGLALFPLRQLVRIDAGGASAPAGERLHDWLARPARFRLLGHGGGGQICAVGTAALEEAQRLLRQAYGERIHFGGITVHSWVDDRSGARLFPVMFLRVDAPRPSASALLRVVGDGPGTATDIELQKDRVVVRMEVPLARLPKLEQEILALTDGAAQTMSWLLGYHAGPGLQAQGHSPPPALAPEPCPGTVSDAGSTRRNTRSHPGPA